MRSALSTSPSLPIPRKTFQTQRPDKEPDELRPGYLFAVDELIELTEMGKSSEVGRVKTNFAFVTIILFFLVTLPGNLSHILTA